MSKIVQTIKEYFDNKGIGFNIEEKDEATLFLLGFGNGDDDDLYCKVEIFKERNYYSIMCIPETKFPKRMREGIYYAINEFNDTHSLPSISYNPQIEHINFYIGVIANEDTFNIDTFDEYMETTVQVASIQASRIFRTAVKHSKLMNRLSIRHLSLFKKNQNEC